MYGKIIEKMKRDSRIATATKEKHKKGQREYFIYAAAVFVLPLLYALLAKLSLTGWIICAAIGILAATVPYLVLRRLRKKPKIFIGKIERMEEKRETVPKPGTGVFGRLPMGLAEVYDLVVGVTDEKGTMQAIFVSPQYETVLKIGDTLLIHPDLPYPAHLSNPTKCICMHCGTMQSAENPTCITCGADMYSVHTVK